MAAESLRPEFNPRRADGTEAGTDTVLLADAIESGVLTSPTSKLLIRRSEFGFVWKKSLLRLHSPAAPGARVWAVAGVGARSGNARE
jgi:hypothetical protein